MDRVEKIILELFEEDYTNQEEKINDVIQRLKDIYVDGFRHQYNLILKQLLNVQTKYPNDYQSKLLRLQENIEKIKNYFSAQEQSQAKNCFFKLYDHVNLEISRINYYEAKEWGGLNRDVASNEKLDRIEKKLKDSMLKVFVRNTKLELKMAEAKNDIDVALCDMNSSKIEVISALSIFSAIILTFSGGITLMSGIIGGMAQSTPYRVVFVTGLLGVIFFNTIFMLLYAVARIVGKSISVGCPKEKNASKGCLECESPSCHQPFCKLIHRYPYVFYINIVFVAIMFISFLMWLCGLRPF